ncbi:hypothetical protein AVEN_243331-1 [Araneus ventricosus]|uniref:Uncharacterized protein n=1 Tax=Araneus ventricosus TaxID=182803 RepID=A0A4Y2RY60_ARAVE|nr:hypothetical protein AVEN_243331-1 [Araneus ventricosus]
MKSPYRKQFLMITHFPNVETHRYKRIVDCFFSGPALSSLSSCSVAPSLRFIHALRIVSSVILFICLRIYINFDPGFIILFGKPNGFSMTSGSSSCLVLMKSPYRKQFLMITQFPNVKTYCYKRIFNN